MFDMIFSASSYIYVVVTKYNTKMLSLHTCLTVECNPKRTIRNVLNVESYLITIIYLYEYNIYVRTDSEISLEFNLSIA